MKTPPPPTTIVATVKTECHSDSPPLTINSPNHHKPLYHHHPPPSYKECLKNHAAAMGGHATDGCGEFMPSPTSLKCAACSCHRNFHRREPHHLHHPLPPPPMYQPHHRHHPLPPPPMYQPHHRHHHPPPPTAGIPQNSPSPPLMALALTTIFPYPPADNTRSGACRSNPSGQKQKRLRTKFTQHQKQKMHEFAETVEWKMGSGHEDIIIAFCNEIGVSKHVFKVWMHNKKTNKKDVIGNIKY